MATNNMTPEQDLIAREFFQKVANDPALFASDKVGQRRMNSVILQLLNYDYVAGAFVTRGMALTSPIGGQPDVTCEWEADNRRAWEAVHGKDNDTSDDQADSSESATDTEVRETVLREDV